ncbi:MAG: tetratricopeptide repeat protein [Ignavibacteriae bacterium]|nr:tetratricopeptide repeat protein [Ignavibacteriota bacterium]
MRFFQVLVITLLVSVFPAFSQDTKENADFKLAVNLYNDKLYDLALEQFQQFISRYPNSQQAVEAKFYLGQAQSKLGRHEDARFTFQNFALSYPDNPRAPEAWWNVAEAYAAQKNFREAAVSYERIKVFHPKSKLASSGLLKASEYFDTAGDRASAVRMLRSLVREYPSAEEATSARLELAELSINAGEFETTRGEVQRIITTTKNAEEKARAQLLLVRALMGLSLYQDAEKTLNEILKNQQSSAYFEALLIKGLMKQLLSGNTQEAVATWQIVASDSQRAPAGLRLTALLEIGESYKMVRDYTKALSAFELAAALTYSDPMRSSEVLYRTAVVAEKAQQFKKAGEYYIHAQRVDSSDGAKQNLLVGAFKGATFLQNYAEATRYASLFKSEFPNDPLTSRILYEAAQVALVQMKDPQLAAQLYKGVVTEYSSSQWADDALLGAGTALAQSANPEGALQVLENFEGQFPGSELVERARDEAWRIKHFALKSREAGLEKLALLIGDVIAQKSKGDLAFRLGEIYFHDLKEYDRAAQQYELALESDVEAAKRPAARYALARSYEILAWKVSLDGKEDAALIAEALKNYELLLRAFPVSEFRNEAVVSLFTLRLQIAKSLTEIRTLHDEFSREYPDIESREKILLRISDAYRKLDGDEDAIATYGSILQSQPSPETPEAMFQLALALRETGREDSAFVLLQSFSATYAEHFRSAEAVWMLGQMAAQRGEIQRALEAYDRIEKLYPYSSFANGVALARAKAFSEAADNANALAAYEQYFHRLEADYYSFSEPTQEVLYSAARCYELAGNKAEAKRYYHAALAQNPDAPEAGEIYFALASIAREEGNVELATQYLQRAGSASGGSADQRVRAALEAANLLFRGESYREAIARYNDVVKETTADSLKQYAQARIAISYYRMNNAGEASKLVAAFVKARPNARNEAAEFEFERGRYLLRREEFDKAKTAFETLLDKYEDAPIAVDAQYWLGRVIEAKGEVQAARETYEAVVKSYPNHPIAFRARLSLGNMFYTAEQWEPAVDQYRIILENEQIAPDVVPFAMTNLILTYKELSLFDAALELTRKFIERFPGDSSVLNKRIDIGVLYQKLGYFDQSVLHLQSLIENAEPDIEAELRYYIGEAYYYKGDHQQAILEFLKVPYLVTRRTSVDWVAASFYMAGQSYEKMSRFDQAISMYQQILERQNIDPQFKAAAQKEIDRVNALVKSQR